MAPPVSVESGFEGGHGSHWDAVLEDAGELARVVGEVYKRGTSGAPAPFATPNGIAKARLRALPFAAGAFEMRIIEVERPGESKPGIATVYPHMREAARPLEARPARVIEWGDGTFEAEVGATVGSEANEVVFFATDYHERKAAYRNVGAVRIALSAIAYTCGTIAAKERLEAFAGGHVDVSSSTIVAPLKDSERAPYYDDDFFLQGPLAACAPFSYAPWGEGAVLRLDLGELGAVPMFARKKDFPHGWPKPGEFVAAYAWLQGRVA